MEYFTQMTQISPRDDKFGCKCPDGTGTGEKSGKNIGGGTMVVRNIPRSEWDSEPGGRHADERRAPLALESLPAREIGVRYADDVRGDVLEQATGLEEEA